MNRKNIILQFVLFNLIIVGFSQFFFCDTVNASIDLTDDVVVNYHLNAENGINANDSSGNNYNGTLINMENEDWKIGKINNCLEFDGINEYVVCGNIANFERNDKFSFESWVKTSGKSHAHVMLSKWSTSAYRGWLFYLSSSGKSQFLLAHTSSNRGYITGSDILDDNTWHHIIVTYDGSSNMNGVKIYVDGIFDSATVIGDNSLTSTILNNNNCNIGARNGYDLFFDGLIDESVIYNKELNQSEVDFRYNNGNGRECFITNVYVDDNQIISWYDATHVKTITEGINNVSDNGIVFVYYGNYNENIIIDKTITLITNENAKINPTSPSTNAVVYISENNVIFDGFEITQNSGSQISKGIKVNADNVLLKNLTVYNFGDELIYLSSVSGANYLNIDNCTLFDNGDFALKCGSDGGAYSNNVTVKNCSIYDTTGIWVYKGTGWLFEYNSIHDVSNMGIGLDSGGNHIVRYNKIYNFSKAGIKAEKTSEIYHNTITMANSGSNSSYYGSAIAVKSGFTGGLIKDNIITNCKKGIYMRSIPVVITIDYNNVWNNNVNYYDCNAGIHDICQNPLFAHLYLFDLLEGSSCLNNASDNTNIGWYQGLGFPIAPDFYFTNRKPLNNTESFNFYTWLYNTCNVTNSKNDNMNIDFYISKTGLTGSYDLLFEFKNVSYKYFCVDIIENYYITLNTSYYWYVYAEITTEISYNSQSNVFNFNTTIQESNETTNNSIINNTVTIDNIQFVITIQIILFMIFMWLGYSIPAMDGNNKSLHYMPFSGGLFIIFGAIDFISLSILLNIYDFGLISEFLILIGIIILLYGVLKAFYYE